MHTAGDFLSSHMAEEDKRTTHDTEEIIAVDGPEMIRSTQALHRPVTPLSPLTHIAIFAAILAPTAVLPYLIVRWHLLSLHRKVAKVGVASAALQQDLKAALLETSVRREEHDRLRILIDELRRDLEKARLEENRKELSRARLEEKFMQDLEDLFAQKQRTRQVLCRQASMRLDVSHMSP